MKQIASVGCLLALCLCAFPAHTASSQATRVWEGKLKVMLAHRLCGKAGHIVRIFRIPPKACLTTFDFAYKQCVAGMRQVSYYKVFNRPTGMLWGKMIGMCVGHAYDHKYTFKTPIP